MPPRPGLLVTADGEVFSGISVGVDGVTTGEVVFNTSMTGYQEVLTDPSYAGQVVVMTSAHIGNYGIAATDSQARTPAAAGMVMRSLASRPSHPSRFHAAIFTMSFGLFPRARTADASKPECIEQFWQSESWRDSQYSQSTPFQNSSQVG